MKVKLRKSLQECLVKYLYGWGTECLYIFMSSIIIKLAYQVKRLAMSFYTSWISNDDIEQSISLYLFYCLNFLDSPLQFQGDADKFVLLWHRWHTDKEAFFWEPALLPFSACLILCLRIADSHFLDPPRSQSHGAIWQLKMKEALRVAFILSPSCSWVSLSQIPLPDIQDYCLSSAHERPISTYIQ